VWPLSEAVWVQCCPTSNTYRETHVWCTMRKEWERGRHSWLKLLGVQRTSHCYFTILPKILHVFELSLFYQFLSICPWPLDQRLLPRGTSQLGVEPMPHMSAVPPFYKHTHTLTCAPRHRVPVGARYFLHSRLYTPTQVCYWHTNKFNFSTPSSLFHAPFGSPSMVWSLSFVFISVNHTSFAVYRGATHRLGMLRVEWIASKS